MHAHACGGQGSTPGASSNTLCLMFWDGVYHGTWSSLIYVDLLASDLQGSSSPAMRLQVYITIPAYLHGFCGPDLRPSCFWQVWCQQRHLFSPLRDIQKEHWTVLGIQLRALQPTHEDLLGTADTLHTWGCQCSFFGCLCKVEKCEDKTQQKCTISCWTMTQHSAHNMWF